MHTIVPIDHFIPTLARDSDSTLRMFIMRSLGPFFYPELNPLAVVFMQVSTAARLVHINPFITHLFSRPIEGISYSPSLEQAFVEILGE